MQWKAGEGGGPRALKAAAPRVSPQRCTTVSSMSLLLYFASAETCVNSISRAGFAKLYDTTLRAASARSSTAGCGRAASAAVAAAQTNGTDTSAADTPAHWIALPACAAAAWPELLWIPQTSRRPMAAADAGVLLHECG